jgi:hypothetical protein
VFLLQLLEISLAITMLFVSISGSSNSNDRKMSIIVSSVYVGRVQSEMHLEETPADLSAGRNSD